MGSISVIVFTSPGCSWCRTAKEHLRRHQVSFREVDISRDERAARDLQRMTGQTGVPVIMINNRPVVGFKKDEINRLLGIK